MTLKQPYWTYELDGQKYLAMYNYKLAKELGSWDYDFVCDKDENGNRVCIFRLLGNSDEPLEILNIILANSDEEYIDKQMKEEQQTHQM